MEQEAPCEPGGSGIIIIGAGEAFGARVPKHHT